MNDKKGKRGKPGMSKHEEPEFAQQIIDLARVTRVMAGGKRMRFRACVVIGNKKGKVAIGLAKGADVTMAINKAVAKAHKDVVTVPLYNETITHDVHLKYKSAKILLKTAPKGKGIIAGGAVRTMLEYAGVPNVVAKIMGSNNKVANAQATLMALKSLRQVSELPWAKKAENKDTKIAEKIVSENTSRDSKKEE